jgi:transposase
MVLVDGAGVPLGVHLSPANLAESHLAEATLATVAVKRRGAGRPKRKPARIIADRGYDSRRLWTRLKARGIQLIAPHQSNRTHLFQDGRALRRYRRRWIIERTNAWLLNFRRLTVRYDHHLEHYRAFVYLACALIALRQF